MLPITNLGLSAIATELAGGKSTPPFDVSVVFNNINVNGWGLDPSYCDGSTNTDRLTTLRTAPLQIGRFRNYDHAAINVDCSFTISQTDGRGYSMYGTLYLVRKSDKTNMDSLFINQQNSVTSSFTGISYEYYLDFSFVLVFDELGGFPVITTQYSWSESNSSTSGNTGTTDPFTITTDFTLTIAQ